MKVYLGKSYQSNPDLVVATNSLLNKNKVEIVKYAGGAYDPDLIINHDPDYVLIIPPYFTQSELEEIEDRERDSFYIGKGNDSESRKLPERTFFVIPDPNFEIGDIIKIVSVAGCTIEIKEYEPRRTWTKVTPNHLAVTTINAMLDPEKSSANKKDDIESFLH
ncbi:MAG TPA: hypothetical protein VJ962_12695 [Clostridia bacterium]|nr:hypothetical protein [Clostridia bacterium]